jgi:precorrin-2/cobalt-factor-2 C20-methyltransferase
MTECSEGNKKIGKLIGASLGPGDPGLITRCAWDVLHSGARWVYPVKRADEDSYALAIVRRAGLAVPAAAVKLVFPMTRDVQALGKAWADAAGKVAEILSDGNDAVFLVEGDASTYATFGHLARVVRECLPEVEVVTIPGVSSFAAAAAAARRPLAEEDETLAVVPAAYGIGVIDRMLDEFDSLILLKVKPILDEIISLAERRGLLAESCFIERVGAPDERIVRDVLSLRGASVNYLSLMLVRNPERRRRKGDSRRAKARRE